MAKKKDKNITAQLVIKSPRRDTSDVGTWRQALKSADNENTTKLYDLYEDLLIDGVLADAQDKRVSAITNTDLTFQDTKGREVEVMTDLIDTLAFEDLLRFIMKSKFYGRSAFEFDFKETFKVSEIPPVHINLKKKEIRIKAGDMSGIPYENIANVVVLGKEKDYGLFLKTAPYAIYKRGGFGDYAQWLEIFGMPQRVGKYNSHDTKSRELLERAMELAGAAPWLVIPKEADVETVNNTGNGSSGISYNDFRKACNEEMLITIQGQTLTTIAGDKGARSLGEVHQDISDEKHLSDMRFVQRVLNQYVLPILEARGFPTKGGKFLFPKAVEPLSVSEIVSLSNILPIPQGYLYDKYGIPAPTKNEATASRQTAEPKKEEPNPKDEEKPKKTEEKPTPKGKEKGEKPIENSETDQEEKGFFKRLFDFFGNAPKLKGAVGDHLMLNDKDLNDRIIGRINGENKFDVELFEFFKNEFLKALNKERKTELNDRFDIVYGYESDAFKTAQELNVFHFSAAKTLAEITRLNQLYRESKNFEDFYQKASEVTDVFNKRWQKTEYETAMLIAESADNYQRLIKKRKLFPYWEYKTIGDDKVRKEHELLHGLILPAGDTAWEKIFPPNGWKCRCYIVARMPHEVKDIDFTKMREKAELYLSSADFKKAKAQGFGVNRALNPEIFKANQMYLNKFPQRAGKLLKDINYQTYKLGSYKQNREKADKELPLYQGKASDFFDKLESEDGKIFFRDYNNRMILFDEKKYLKGHTPKKYKVRTQYLEAAQEALKNPNEVWLSAENNDFNTFFFIKYYKGTTIAVVAELKGGQVYRVKTWFPLVENKVTSQYRGGLLIKKQP